MGRRDYWKPSNPNPSQHNRKDSGSNMAVLMKDGSLEIVSEENFRQRKNGIASVDSCKDCLKERGKDGKRSRKRKKKEAPTKLNSPIVVHLSDSIKVSVKGKMKRSPKSSDMESACSTDSEDNIMLDGRNKENVAPNYNAISKSEDLRAKAIKGNMRLKAEKNFNAFLTAIEKVHRKDNRGTFGKGSYKSNLLTENNMLMHSKENGSFMTPPHSSLLNNFRDYHYGNHNSSYLPRNPRGLRSIDLNTNVKFVQNDLRGKGLMEKQDSLEESESGSVISTSTDYHSDIESGSSSSIESAEELTHKELRYLSGYTSGTPLTRYDCPPHECPECLEAYYSYTHYYPQGSDMFTFEVLEGDQYQSRPSSPTSTGSQDNKYNSVINSRSQRSSTSSQLSAISAPCGVNTEADDDDLTYHVTITGNNSVEVSLVNFHSTSEEDENNEIYEELDRLEKTQQKERKHTGNSKKSKKTNALNRKRYNSANSSNSSYSNCSSDYFVPYYNNYRNYPSPTPPPSFYSNVEASSPSISSRTSSTSSSSSTEFDNLDTISIDLSNNSEVTFTVEYHTQETSSRKNHHNRNNRSAANDFYYHNHHHNRNQTVASSGSFSFLNNSSFSHQGNNSSQQHYHHQMDFNHDMFHYNFYTTMVGFFPYALPYYMTPPYFYMCPLMMSIPRPLVVPRDLQCLSSQRLCLIPASEIKQFTSSQPPQRPWMPIAHPESNKPVAIYTVMCYNVLCDKYCTNQLYGYCPSWALNWEYRKKAIIEEIRQYSADIISLQEVETEQFHNFFLPELKRDGYNGIFSPKSRAKTMSDMEKKHVDGCAIFFRATKFTLVKEQLVEFNQLAMSTAEGSHDMINRVMTKDNIGLAALLETKEAIWENGMPSNGGKMPILVATCHVHWDPEFSDVKLIQTMMLMSELKNIVEESGMSLRPGSTAPDTNSVPLLLCGDLNSLPDSGVVEYLTSGKVSANHEDFRGLGYSECLSKLNLADNSDLYTHGFRMMQAYEKNVLPYTNYTFDFKGIIDYIFFSKDFMRPLGVLGPLDTDWFRENKVIGCPHPHIPSDHLPLLVEVEMSASPTPQPAGRNQTIGSSTRR